jgi:predicted MPP superfamily phosphohydrolase
MKILFPLILLLFFGAVHYLSYSRMVKRFHLSTGTKKLLLSLLITNMIMVLGYVASRYYFDIPLWLYRLFSLSIGIGFTLFIALLLYELLHLLQHHLPFQEEKRRSFKRISDLGFLALGGGYVAAALIEGAKRPVVNYVIVPQNRFNGKNYRIVQISDMHIGGLIDQDFVNNSITRINALNPDIVVITGDLVDMPIMSVKAAVDELKGIKSRYGVYFVAGNHEYFHGIEETLAYLQTIGIEVLGNRSVELEDFTIVGVYDIFGYRVDQYVPDLSKATKGLDPEKPTLLLAHQPKYIEYLDGFEPSLMLSGHTHGGQLWPFGYLVALVQPYVKGLHKLGDDRHIYVNSGIGFWGPPMRLGSAAEITCLDWS